MATKPILFNTDMVRAIQDGRKTVTRRVFKPHNSAKANSWGYYQGNGLWVDTSTDNPDNKGHIKDYSISSLWMSIDYYIEHYAPYQPGDILYVRETWCWCPCWDCGYCEEETYKCLYEGANQVHNGAKNENGCYVYRASEPENEEPDEDTWHPSIHMPKEAARIWLRVTDVRAERLQKCGKAWCVEVEKSGIKTPQDPILYTSDEKYHEALRAEFKRAWDSTIKKSDLDRYGWEANPWVWVIEFERCEKPEGV